MPKEDHENLRLHPLRRLFVFSAWSPAVGVVSPATPGRGAPRPPADGDFKIGPPYADAPELTVKDGVPKGTLHEFTMDSQDSKIYPGLNGAYKRKVAVYVPNGYVPDTAAPFIVVQDAHVPRTPFPRSWTT